MTALDQKRAEVFARRKALLAALRDARRELSPSALADDALRRLDPERQRLATVRERLMSFPLVGIALLAGLGWLFGSSGKSKPMAATAKVTTTPKSAKQKEKQNDSGKRNGKRRTGTAARRTQDPFAVGPSGQAEDSLADIVGQAQQARHEQQRVTEPQGRGLGLAHSGA